MRRLAAMWVTLPPWHPASALATARTRLSSDGATGSGRGPERLTAIPSKGLQPTSPQATARS